MERTARKNIFLVLGIAVIAFLDIITKFAVIMHLKPGQVIEMTSFFNMVFVLNKGIGFSLLSNVHNANLIMLAINSVVCLLLLVWMMREKNTLTTIGLMSVIGGAIGNLLDRATQGGVVDFLDFHLKGKHWPAFNLADAAICLGAFLIILSLFKGSNKNA